GADGSLSGSIDEVAIYASALSALAINAHWQAGSGASCPATPTTGYAGTILSDGPVRYFRLGETSGRAAADYSGNCHAGAYTPGAIHGAGAIISDTDGGVGSPPSGGATVQASADTLPGGAHAHRGALDEDHDSAVGHRAGELR